MRVEVRGFGWRHAGRRAWAVRDVELTVEPGERVLLLGASGSGKSTLLAGMGGLLHPEAAAQSEGRILIDGTPAAAARERSGLLAQDPESGLVMSRAGDDVAFGLENRAVPAEDIWPAVAEALTAVGFPYGPGRSTRSLSGGEKQRLALAGLLAGTPGLLLLDEPTAQLDAAGTRLFTSALARILAGRRHTVVLVEHRVDAVLDLVDRVVVLQAGGGISADGSPAQVFGRSAAALAAGVWTPGLAGRLAAAAQAERPAAAGHVEREPAARAAPGRHRNPLLSGEGLTWWPREDHRPVLERVDVTVSRGEALVVTGPNGSGKSTLALLLAGLLAPRSGGSILCDQPHRPLHLWPARKLAQRVGTVFQEPEHQFLTGKVADEMLVGGSDKERRRLQKRASGLLERLGLDALAAANPFTLSGGEKRRLSVATALVREPDVLILDEPTFGQDARTWQELLTLCGDLRDAGTALLGVTHDEEFAEGLADRRLRWPPAPLPLRAPSRQRT